MLSLTSGLNSSNICQQTRVFIRHYGKSRSYQENKRTYIIVFSIVGFLLFLYWYWLMVTDYGHGTFLPPFVWATTTDFNAKIQLSDISSIPTNFKPSFRVVISMTTMPHHLKYLSETLDSLMSQTLLPDAIYLNIPQGKARTGEEYYVPEYLNKYTSNGILIINRCEKDYGPLTKLFPTLQKETKDDTLIITVDDDQVYDINTVKTISYYSSISPNNAWGDCGWSFLKVPHEMEITRVYVPFLMRNHGGKKVEVIEGICGNGYRRNFFKDLNKLENHPKECFTTDDLWMAGYLQFINGPNNPIPRVLIKENFAPKKTEWKKNNEDWTKTLMSHNVGQFKTRINCLRAIEELFDATWLD